MRTAIQWRRQQRRRQQNDGNEDKVNDGRHGRRRRRYNGGGDNNWGKGRWRWLIRVVVISNFLYSLSSLPIGCALFYFHRSTKLSLENLRSVQFFFHSRQDLKCQVWKKQSSFSYWKIFPLRSKYKIPSKLAKKSWLNGQWNISVSIQ